MTAGAPRSRRQSRPRALRAGARDNRNRIIEVARKVYATAGLDVTMREIAHRADVGVATLYRRFPSKDLLIQEVFVEQVAACVETVDRALADPDPWRGFCRVVEKACTMRALNRAFISAFLLRLPHAVDLRREFDHNARGFAVLTRRAKASGRLRADFQPGDLEILLMANGGIVMDDQTATLAASRKLVALLLRALHAHPAARPIGL